MAYSNSAEENNDSLKEDIRNSNSSREGVRTKEFIWQLVSPLCELKV
jgi:hypothetical protein